MTISISTVVILSLIAAAVLWSLLFRSRLPKPYRFRTCQGKSWRSAFPTSSKADIRKFLSVFVNAFAFSQQERLKLHPEDQVLQVYRACYPYQWTPDGLELEALARDLETTFSLSLEGIWHNNLTLGELFADAQKTGTS
jgi:propanediol dehydratase small subunit